MSDGAIVDGTNGASGDDVISATSDDGANLVGGSGDDTLSGGSGDDTLNGGSGTDTAIYDGNVQVYLTDGLLTFTDEKGNMITFDAGDDGLDTLKSIEIIQFNNYTYYMDGTNNAVLAQKDVASTDEGSSIDNISVLDNDLDLDGDELVIIAGSLDISDSVGTFILNIDGTISYDPAGGFEYLAAGQIAYDTVTYTVSDGKGSTDTGVLTVKVTGVNDAPVVVNESDFDVVEDAGLIFGEVSANDVDYGAILTYSLLGEVPQGLIFNSDGSYSFDPSNVAYQSLAEGQQATVSFTWQVSDGELTDSSTVNITITGTNDAAIVSSADVTLEEIDDVLTTSGTLTSIDIDNADNSFTVSETVGTYGDFSIDAGGNWGFIAHTAFDELNESESYSETFNVTSIDGTASTVKITITGTSDAPALLEGAVSDGYIVGATVFADNNNNGLNDDGVSTLTNGVGGFTLEGATGGLYMSGGTDAATGLAFEGVLRAPAGSTSITALTTLIAEVEDLGSLNAAYQVGSAFGITDFNSILTTDPIEATLSGDAATAVSGMALMGFATQVLNTVIQIASLVEGVTGGAITISEAIDEVFDELAVAIKAYTPYNLTDSVSISDLISAVTGDLTEDVLSSAASLISDANVAVESILVEGADYLTAVTQVSIVAQGESASAMSADASTGTATTIAMIDATLDALIDNAVVGDIDGAKAAFTYNPIGNVDLIRSNLLPGEGDFMLVDHGTGELVSSGDAGQLVFDTTSSINSSNRLQIAHGQDNEFASIGMADYGIVYQGGAGIDWLFFGVGSEQYSLGVNIEAHGGGGNDRLSGGKDGDDLLYGDAGNDDLTGLSGNDVLVGGRGNDNLTGGAGSDQFVFENGDANDLGTEFDLVYDFSVAEGDVLDLTGLLSDVTTGLTEDGASLENLLNITSDGSRSWIHIDLNSDAVTDQIIYLDGIDLTQVPTDVVSEPITYQVASASVYNFVGTDSGHIYADSIFGGGFGTYDLINNIQSLAATTQLVIDNSSNTSAATTHLHNEHGVDFSSHLSEDYGFVYLGGTGSDYLYVRNPYDPLGTNIEAHGGAGNDSVNAGDGNDLLYGDSGNDSLNGRAGDDVLVGGFGKDTMTGGDGADTFTFIQGEQNYNFVTGSDYADYLGNDNIYDFNVAEGDVLDLSDLLSGLSGLVESGESLDSILNFTANKTLEIDVDGDGVFSEGTDLNIDFGYYSDDLNQGGALSDVEVIDSLLASGSLEVIPTATGSNSQIIDHLLSTGNIDLIV